MTIKLSSLRKRKKFKERLSPPQVGIVTFIGDELIPISTNQPFIEWVSGTIAQDNNIYCFPWNNNAIIKIDPTNEIITQIPLNPLTGAGNTSDNYACSATVLAPNGKIYSLMLGFNVVGISKTAILEFDPIGSQITKIIDVDPSFDCQKLCLAPNGKIYAAPLQSNKVLEIDPVAGVSTTGRFADVASGDLKWAGNVLGPNGKIYGIPLNATSVLEIDPIAGTTSSFGSLSSDTLKWRGGCLAPNGKIYGFPANSTSILEIDPIAKTISTFGNITSRSVFNGFLGQDGKIYLLPNTSDKILQVDIDTKVISEYYTFSELHDIGVGILAKNGNVYCPPSGKKLDFAELNATTNRVLKIGIQTASKPHPYILSPYQNNF